MAKLLVHVTHGPEHPIRAALGFLVAKTVVDEGALPSRRCLRCLHVQFSRSCRHSPVATKNVQPSFVHGGPGRR